MRKKKLESVSILTTSLYSPEILLLLSEILFLDFLHLPRVFLLSERRASIYFALVARQFTRVSTESTKFAIVMTSTVAVHTQVRDTSRVTVA